MSRFTLALLLCTFSAPACSDPGRGAPTSERSASAPAAEGPASPAKLSPGADIDPRVLDQLDTDQRASVAGGEGVLAPLGADRPLSRVAVPDVPRAATATFSFADGKRGWVTRLPTGEHIPSVAYGGGRVYASGGFSTYSFYALDAQSGRMEWNRQDLEDNGPTAPSYLDDDVIFNTESCTLFVLDARTGRKRWHLWLGDPTLAQPAVEHGLIFASYPAQGGQHLGALRLRDGHRVWSRAVDGELLTAPVVEGDWVYATTVRGTVYRFHARSGRQRWARRLRATSAPWIAEAKVYVGQSQGGSREAQVVLDAETGKTLATVRQASAEYLGDVPRDLRSWPQVWAFEGSRPLVALGRVLDTMANTVSATDAATHRTLWQRTEKKEPARGGARSLTPPVLAGSLVVFASRRGQVYALDIDTGMTVWAYDIGRAIAASPVVARGWVYLSTSDGSIVALEAGDASLDGWHMWGGGPGHNGARS